MTTPTTVAPDALVVHQVDENGRCVREFAHYPRDMAHYTDTIRRLERAFGHEFDTITITRGDKRIEGRHDLTHDETRPPTRVDVDMPPIAVKVGAAVIVDERVRKAGDVWRACRQALKDVRNTPAEPDAQRAADEAERLYKGLCDRVRTELLAEYVERALAELVDPATADQVAGLMHFPVAHVEPALALLDDQGHVTRDDAGAYQLGAHRLANAW